MTPAKLLRDQSGVALFMVLWVLTLLTVIVGQFCFSMRSEANLARNFKEAAEAAYIAEAGLDRAIWELMPEAPGATDSAENVWRVNRPIPAVSFGAGAYTVRIDNDSGRIDLNTADRGLLRLAVERLPVDEADKDIIVDSILDWRDADELHRASGAESDYYRSLQPPHHSKNGPFDTVEELLMVRGVTPDLFYGGLGELVTVGLSAGRVPGAAARARRRAPVGGGININAAPEALLSALPGMTEDLARDVTAYRVSKDFEILNDVMDVVGGDLFASIAPYLSLAMSPVYTIRSEGRVEGSRVRQAVTARVIIDPTSAGGYRIIRRYINDRHLSSSIRWEETRYGE